MFTHPLPAALSKVMCSVFTSTNRGGAHIAVGQRAHVEVAYSGDELGLQCSIAIVVVFTLSSQLSKIRVSARETRKITHVLNYPSISNVVRQTSTPTATASFTPPTKTETTTTTEAMRFLLSR